MGSKGLLNIAIFDLVMILTSCAIMLIVVNKPHLPECVVVLIDVTWLVVSDSILSRPC